MQIDSSLTNKQNRHPNKFRVQEGDFSKISNQYILEGETLKVRSIFDCEKKHILEERIIESKKQQDQQFNQQDYARLEYLDELEVLNQEQKKLLERMRKFKRQNHINQKSMNLPAQRLPFAPIKNQPQYFPSNKNQFYHQNSSFLHNGIEMYQGQQQILPFSRISYNQQYDKSGSSEVYQYNSYYQ